MTRALADQIQLWGFEKDYLIYSDGSYGFGLRFSPIDISCWENSRVDAFAARLGNFLNSLPEGIDLQFIQEIKAENAEILSNYGRLAKSEGDICCQLHTSRMSFLKEQDRYNPRFECLIFVRRAGLTHSIRKPKLFGQCTQFEEVAEKSLENELASLEQVGNDLMHSLEGLGFHSEMLHEREIALMVYRDWNPVRKVELRNYDPEDIRSSLLFTDLGVSRVGFSLGSMEHRVVSLKLLPDQTYASMARALARLPMGARTYLSIQIPRQQDELEKLQLQRRLAYSMARGRKVGVSDIESEAKFQDVEGLISEMVSQGEKVFHFSLNVLMRSEEAEVLQEQVAQTLGVLRELSGAEGMEETLASFDIFSDFSIPHARSKERAKRIKTSNLADLLPIYGPWAGHTTPRLLLKSIEGSFVSLDPFSSELSNYNQVITGGSGSGKSFLTNVLLLQMLKENPKIFIVDIGGSYKKLCGHLEGQYIPFSLDSGLAINPFDLPVGETAPSPQKIKYLVGLIEMMTREDGERGIGRLERAEIEEAILEVYESANPKLSDLRSKLMCHSDIGIQRFGKILSSWCGKSPYGQMVDRETSVSLSAAIVSFDLKGLETYPDLQAVCLYLITDFVWREIQKDREAFKFLVFDECWKLLESESGSAFIGEVFRTFRKYFASAIAISQNIDDFARSRVASAILPNTSVKWVLMQKGADQKRLQEVLQLNDNEMALISQLHQTRGAYSQAFLMVEDRHCAVSIEASPLEYWIATSDPRDLAMIEKAKKETDISSFALLTELSQRYPNGVAASTLCDERSAR